MENMGKGVKASTENCGITKYFSRVPAKIKVKLISTAADLHWRRVTQGGSFNEAHL